MRYAGVSKFIVRLYALSMNFGHGKFGFAFCPMAKSNPEPEYSTVLRDPIAFVVLSITVFASCAIAVEPRNRPITSAGMYFLLISPPKLLRRSMTAEKPALIEAVHKLATSAIPLLSQEGRLRASRAGGVVP